MWLEPMPHGVRKVTDEEILAAAEAIRARRQNKSNQQYTAHTHTLDGGYNVPNYGFKCDQFNNSYCSHQHCCFCPHGR